MIQSIAEVLEMDYNLVRILVLALIPYMIVSFALMIAAIIGVMRKNVKGSDKLVWILIIVLVDIIGPIIYFAIGSNQLEKLEEQNQQ